MLLFAILIGALTCAAPPAGAAAALPAQAATVAALVDVTRGGGPRVPLQHIGGGGFCHWHSGHHLCVKLIVMRRFCEGRPDHRLCADDDDDRFCQIRPDHPLCDDDRFCKKRPDHPLCDDGQPPSPS